MALNDIQQDALVALRRLRWVLKSLQFGGIGDFPRLPTVVREHDPDPTVAHHDHRHIDPADLLRLLRDELGECRRCRLHSGRKHVVFADGTAAARLVFVGEGPGYDEDQQGLPFVGRAGKLLDKMIKSMGLHRGDVYICNVVKCRPPGNRTPNPDEIEVCSPYLFKQIEAIHPAAVCALGACAAQTLLGTTSPISRLRNRVHYWRGIPLICTFHPAYLLRNPAQKSATWQDMLSITELLHSAQAGR